MSDTRTKRDGHDVVVRTEKGSIPGHETRTTFVDGKAESIADHNTRTGETREYTSVDHGLLGPTPSGTFKK